MCLWLGVCVCVCVRACECACKLTSTDGRLEVSHWIAFSQSVQQLWRRQQQNNIAFQAVLCSLDSHSCYPATVGAVHSGARGAKKRKPSHKLSCSTIIKIYGRSARFNTCDIYIFHFITIRLNKKKYYTNLGILPISSNSHYKSWMNKIGIVTVISFILTNYVWYTKKNLKELLLFFIIKNYYYKI